MTVVNVINFKYNMCQFNEIAQGDWFVYREGLYLKRVTGKDFMYNAVNVKLKTGGHNFSPDDLVSKVKRVDITCVIN